MIHIDFSRESVCMGDDYYAGTYSMEFAEDAVMKDLVTVILNGGHGNTWPVARVASWREDWVIKTNVGILADIHAKFGGKWKVNYQDFAENRLLKDSGIVRTYAERI